MILHRPGGVAQSIRTPNVTAVHFTEMQSDEALNVVVEVGVCFVFFVLFFVLHFILFVHIFSPSQLYSFMAPL